MEILDDIDRQIIEFLTKDSRASFRKIAKQTDVSVDTITRRYQKLEKNNVIQPTITVNLRKLGYEAVVFFGLKVASQNVLRKITEKVGTIPDITAVMETTGEYDLTVIAAVRNITHTFKVGEDISKVPGVRRVSIDKFALPSLPPWKDSVYPPPIWHNLDVGTK
jgi:Lrp/AsnC family transcriptional regulator for asnA, asnC and gidA